MFTKNNFEVFKPFFKTRSEIGRVADPDHCNADLDPDPAPHQSDGNLRPSVKLCWHLTKRAGSDPDLDP
jgi:hypothetical protein